MLVPNFLKRTTHLIVAASLAVFLLAASAQAKDYSFTWDPNIEPDIAGYRIHYKTGSSGPPYDGTHPTNPDFDSPIDVGNTTDYTIQDLDEDTDYYLVVTAYNTEGLESDYSNQVSTSPIGITSSQDGFYVNADNYSAFDISGSTNTAETIYVYANDTFLGETVASADGSWSYTADFTSIDQGWVSITAVTLSGAVSPTVTGYYDKTQPVFSQPPAVSGISDDAAVVTWHTAEVSDSEIQYSTNSSTWGYYDDAISSDSAVTEHSFNLSGLFPSTDYYFRVRSKDAAGNTVTSSEIQFTTAPLPDTDPPLISSILHTDSTNSTATIQWTTDEPSNSMVAIGSFSTIWGGYDLPISQDDTLVTTHTVTLTGLTGQTRYYFRVGSRDAYGNLKTSMEDSFTTDPDPDTRAPVITPPLVESSTDTTATIVWTTDEPADSYVEYGTTSINDFSWEKTDFVTEHRAFLSGLEPETTYLYRVSSADDDGNGPTVSMSATFTTDPAPDTQPPTIISAVSVAERDDTTATIEWATDEPGNSQVRYGNNSSQWTEYPANVTLTELKTVHRVKITGLDPKTKYYFRAGSTDVVSNGPVISEEGNFDTMPVPDTTPPVITAPPLVGSKSNHSASIAWMTDEPGNSQVRYGTRSADWNDYPLVVNDIAMVSQHAAVLNNLDGNTTYYFRVGSTDEANNGPTVSAEVVFTTEMDPDILPPVFTTSVAVNSKSHDSATIQWTTNEPSNSQVQFGTYSSEWDAYPNAKNNADLLTDHTVVLTGLAGGTTYYLRAGSMDQYQNGPTYSNQIMFTTYPEPDIEAPQFNAPPAATNITNTSVNIEWTTDEPSNSEIRYGVDPASTWDSYSLSKNESAMVTNHSVVITGLMADTVYYFHVGSTDGNENGPVVSGQHIFRTEPAPDTVAPNFIAPPTVTGKTTSSAIIEWATDEVSNSQIHYGTTSSTWENYDTVINSAEMVTGHSVTLTGLSPETTYYFRTGSTDALNNGPQVSNEFSFTTQRETDLSRPVITGPPTVTAVTDRSATIEWQTDEPSDSEVRYGTKKAKWERYPFVYTDQQMVTAHRVTVTGLAAEEIYYFMVGSTDASGNQPNTSPSEKNNPFSQDTFTTEKIPDTAAPVIISEPTVTSFDSTTATVEWVTDEPSNSSVFYIKSDALGSATADEFLLSSEEESAMVTKHLVTITNLDPGEEYTFLASSVDKDGNGPGLEESAENLSSALELTTKKDPDHFAPVISDVTMMYATDTTAIITWQTDEPSNSVVKFGPVSADWSDYAKTESDGEMTTRHAVTITGLVPDTRYYFSVASTDAFGNGPFYNSNASNPHRESYFTTAAYPDDEAPEMPSVIKITTNAPERSAVVTWTTKEPGSSQVRYDTTSRGWEGYRFSENDAELVRSHSVTLTNLEVGTVYFVRVSSVDAAGNNYEVSNYDMNPSREFNFVMEGIGEMDYTASSETGEEGTATCFIQSTRAEMPGGQFVVTILLMVLAAFVVTVARQRK